jgi:hypothetical protein
MTEKEKEKEKSRLNELTDFTEDFQERLRKSYERIENQKSNPSEILTKKNISKVYSKNENEKSKEKSTNIALVIKKILTNIKNYII